MWFPTSQLLRSPETNGWTLLISLPKIQPITTSMFERLLFLPSATFASNFMRLQSLSTLELVNNSWAASSWAPMRKAMPQSLKSLWRPLETAWASWDLYWVKKHTGTRFSESSASALNKRTMTGLPIKRWFSSVKIATNTWGATFRSLCN